MENKSPSSCVSPAATSTMSAGESSWAMHIANFLVETPQDREMDQQAAVSGGSFSSGFSSSFDSFDDDVSFITSELMCDDEEDESLQDTACSSAAAQKIATMDNFDIKAMSTMDAKEFNMPQLAKYFEAVGSQQEVTKVDHQQLINSYSNKEKALYESNELRRKGLCLVPVSMLINYLG